MGDRCIMYSFVVCRRTIKSRGIAHLDERMVLSVLLVDGPIALPIFHARTAAPDFADDQPDRIYSCSAVDSKGKTLRDSEAKLKEWFKDPEENLMPVAINEVANTAVWQVEYNDERRVRFALRSRTKFHNVTGPNQISLEERLADFTAKVQCWRVLDFVVFPRNKYERAMAAVSACICSFVCLCVYSCMHLFTLLFREFG